MRGNPAPSEGVLDARESIAAQSEFETGAYAAGTVDFLVRGPRPRPAVVRAARSGLQVGESLQLLNSPYRPGRITCGLPQRGHGSSSSSSLASGRATVRFLHSMY